MSPILPDWAFATIPVLVITVLKLLGVLAALHVALLLFWLAALTLL